MSLVEPIVIFTMALSMSLSHCIGMCGGIVIAYSNGKIHKDTHFIYQVLYHFLYNLGRISSYMIIGGISAFIGYGFSLSITTKGILFIIVGVLLVLFAFSYLFFPKILTYIEPSISTNSQNRFFIWFKNIFIWFLTSKNPFSFYGLGILNGFMPCGMVYYFALTAALAQNILMGMITMGIFGIATLIPMLAIGFIARNLLSLFFRKFFMFISFILMLYFGGSSIYKGILNFSHKSSPMQYHSHPINHSIDSKEMF
ncbi:sulfite exporter TauE/SafE family protein [Helicobacter sp. 13S00477-4]|uniref:sulfite exporter TauE/SafE family protein n=1 Tax=Helicobacter sp. 13S00477-4 TaxID=1905759 RepID=UPI000BA6A8C8|nr:sulfite exporter TauE/SafE family protein [Helicobacter sp. 13S00477-4]PAF52648.1 hypothetical protein BKH44_00205 [Helicobacter sp. 13S00477-4]